MARPTKLTKALVAAAEQYKEDTGSFIPNALLPTIEGLALKLGISRDSIYEWIKGEDALSKQFSDIFDDIKALQAEKLIQKSLSGHYNPTIAKMILSGKHGYVEKQATDLTTNGKDLPMPILGAASVRSDSGDKEAS
jgi:hypothetical protein